MTSSCAPTTPAGEPDRAGHSTEDLLRLAAVASEDDAHELIAEVVRRHLPVALSLAGRYRNRGEAWEDLTQVAGLGLVLAAQRFRPEVGVPFLAYAVPTILGELRRHFRDNSWIVKPPRRLQELRPEVIAAQDRLTQRLGRVPTLHEVAQEVEADLVDTVEALTLATAYRPDSLDSPGLPPAEALTAATAPMSEVENRLAVAPALGELPGRTRQVLHLYYVESQSQRQIAERIGVSQMQVSRLLRSALARLQSADLTST